MSILDGKPLEPIKQRDPVHEDGGYWWFWNEIWVDVHGPYITESAAREGLQRYLKFLEGGE